MTQDERRRKNRRFSFCPLIDIFLSITHERRSRRPAFGILSPSQAVKDFHTITRTNACARIHARARIIFASFCKSLQTPYFLFTFTMKTANNEQNATALDNLSRAADRAILGRLKGFKRIPRKKPCFWGGL